MVEMIGRRASPRERGFRRRGYVLGGRGGAIRKAHHSRPTRLAKEYPDWKLAGGRERRPSQPIKTPYRQRYRIVRAVRPPEGTPRGNGRPVPPGDQSFLRGGRIRGVFDPELEIGGGGARCMEGAK